MKKIFLITAVILGCLSFKAADAQLRFSVGVNIGSQPEWGPVGYTHARYYYMPDINSYYDVDSHQYVYLENNIWIHGGALPPRYANYDRYHSYKVVVNDRNPWEHNERFRTRYQGYRGRHDQGVIRDSRDNRYRNHWRGDQAGDRRHDNGRGNDGRDNGRGSNGRDNGERGHDNRERGHGEQH